MRQTQILPARAAHEEIKHMQHSLLYTEECTERRASFRLGWQRGWVVWIEAAGGKDISSMMVCVLPFQRAGCQLLQQCLAPRPEHTCYPTTE